MTAAATKRPFADAQPSELREAILDEDRPEFDRQYLHAMQVATSTLRLDELTAFLEHWRLTAWAQTANGHDAYRAMLTKADRILATGQPEPGSRPWDEVKAELGLQVAYRITVDPVAEAGIKALSTSARRALSEVLTVLSEVPWNGEPTSRDNPGGAVRRFLFGPGGAGMVVYLIVEDDRWVDVLQVHWLG